MEPVPFNPQGYPKAEHYKDVKVKKKRPWWILDLVVYACVLGAAFQTRDIWLGSGKPWPAFAEPMPACAVSASKVFDGTGARVPVPDGWTATADDDAARGVRKVYLAPDGGGTDEVIMILRENQAGALANLVAPAADAAADTGKSPAGKPAEGGAKRSSLGGTVPGTNQTLALERGRQAFGFLTRTGDPGSSATSWMLFVGDAQARMAAVSGPKLPDTKSYAPFQRNKQLNCAFWEVVRGLDLK